MNELRKIINDEDIPSYLGGMCTCSKDVIDGKPHPCLLSNKGPWS